MSQHTFGARAFRSRSLAPAAALDFGLRVRVEAVSEQRTIFSGSECERPCKTDPLAAIRN